jgi:galactose mutarotase-like enzyme
MTHVGGTMTPIAITHGTTEGFATIQVDTGALRLSLIPELGGKINALRDQRTGREWLWRNPRLPYRRVTADSSYVAAADTGGWDECFPTVAPCAYPSVPWQGRALPDHGELWAQTPVVDVTAGPERASLNTRWAGQALPYTFERRVSLSAGSASVRADYTVTNTGDAPLDFIWSIHPLLAIEPGMQLRLPPEARYNRWPSSPADELADHGLRFPLTAGGHDLGTLPDPAAALALKLWSDPLAAGQGWASLQARDGALRMRWDPALLPQVGVWLNLGGWSGDGGAPYYNLGLEPCIGAQDSLADAVSHFQLFAALPPGGARAWWLEIELAQ